MAVQNLAFGGSRLRPVLMTAMTTALGSIPMLLSDGVGAEIQRPLASVIVGGLVTATLLALFVFLSGVCFKLHIRYCSLQNEWRPA